MSISDETENGTPAEGGAPEGERIAKTIARAGLASRRDAEAMIEAGRVSLNGQVLTSPAINVTESDHIEVDGEPLPARERTRLWILHKPRGVVTTARDPEGRQTVFDGLPPDLPRVVAIGRLDINTEGLLLLTNDGGLAKVIAHPETGWLRRYRVRAFGDVTQPDLDRLRKGVSIEGMDYGPIEASLDRAQGDNVWLTLGLREGKNREVKRILEHLGLSVNRLIRLSFGPFQLGDLEVGLVEEIRTKVLKEQLGKTLSEQAGVDFESPVREPIAAFGSPKKKAAQGATAARPPRSGPSPRGDSSRADRPPGRERSGGARPPRDPARPPVPARVPTGGTGPGPRSSIWRAEDAETRPHGSRVPRRGGDPKAARAAAAERGRERVGAITTGERRVVVERLQPTPEAPQSEPHRRVKFRKHDEAAPRRAEGERPPRGESGEGGAARGPARARPPRDEFREGGGPRGPARSERGPRQARDAAPRGEQPFRAHRGDRPAQGRPDQGRPGQGRPSQERPRSDRPSEARGDRPGGGERPGGFKGGRPEGRPGGFKDARPGGARPGGFKGGKLGGRPGGAGPGGFRGGKPGGAGSGGFKGGRSGGGKPGGGKPGPRGGR